MLRRLIKKIVPAPVLHALLPAYHLGLVWLGFIIFRFPSHKIKIVGVTGTKGKSSVCEYVNAILEHAGHKTALMSTIRFKVGADTRPNKLKMTMPGRFFIQRLLRRAVNSGCDWVVLEMTSEGTKQFRHLGLQLDALIFTNIAPEHIESHGSYADYVAAKFKIARVLEKSRKRPRIMIANADDEYGPDFLSLLVEQAVPYSLADAKPYTVNESGVSFTFEGQKVHSPIRGEFTVYNMLAAATFARAAGSPLSAIEQGLGSCTSVPGRVEMIDEGQPFKVVVDYAHTPESLEKLYQAFPADKKICVLGNTGGGRDTWKRPKMGALAEQYCSHVILTDEDPYDEDPRLIVEEMADGMKRQPEILMDRRRAMRRAFSLAQERTLRRAQGDKNNIVVLITGKGTDPYIMRANDAREEWSDAEVAREELRLLFGFKKSSMGES
ncbi:MAG: UDP-N-acetylmuramyl-tripeptide synthetase [bacterium]|nr:UDP-N-acetylmuramyl-tripeptide synthetase [bacterium]